MGLDDHGLLPRPPAPVRGAPWIGLMVDHFARTKYVIRLKRGRWIRHVAFVIDAYARRILGWKVSTSMTTDLVLDAINQAIFTRYREGVKDLSGLIHHNDAGSQYTSVRFTERLLEAGIDASIGTVGDAHDNSLAESINGLYKTELIKPRRPWRNGDVPGLVQQSALV